MRSITLSSVWCKIVQLQDKRILTFAGPHSTVYRQAKSALRLAITRTGRLRLGRSIHSEVIEMIELKKALTALWNDDEGLTTVEYAVAGGLIAAVVVGAFLTLGGTVGGIITYINTQLQASPGA
jgi:pilus assembly protein Flp/PilA